MFPFYKFDSLPCMADLWAIPPVRLSQLSHFSSWEGAGWEQRLMGSCLLGTSNKFCWESRDLW